MKTFLTILILFAALFTFGQQEQQVEIENFKSRISLSDFLINLNHKDIDLAHGIDFSKVVDMKKLNDFSERFSTKDSAQMIPYNVNSENNFFAGYATDSFYNTDFAEDPFDGLIQVLVMGEPLPSPTTTLICALGVIGILLYCKKRKEAEVC